MIDPGNAKADKASLIARAVPLLLLVLAIFTTCSPPHGPVDLAQMHPEGELTFIVAGDSHFGHAGMAEANEKMIKAMNAMPGVPWPTAIGGTVAMPWGVLHTGDMTDSGSAAAWRQFEKMYGLTGKEGLLKYPVFEVSGNHDRLLPLSQVTSKVKNRHGGHTYSWDWQNVHFACVGLYPNAQNLDWLRRDLAKVGPDRPVVLYWHFTPEVNFSIVGKDWTDREKAAALQAIQPYNVIAIFCGHWHAHGHFAWGGHDLFQPGAPRHGDHTFMVVRIRKEQLAVAVWDWEGSCWTAQYVKPLRR